ncbi:thermonuclease family protein [Orbaceae bacterium ESL0727]|nr:thermonuclease family protein [Orbaceae bacterium ESL0727]
MHYFKDYPNRHALKAIFIYLLFFISTINLAHADFKGKVVKIVDGDTIDVLTPEYQKIRVRLNDIDAPERSQAYGKQAQKQLANFIAGKQVFVQENKKDIYQRTLGTIFYNNTNINAKMVETGYAWAYRYKNIANNQNMVELETIAKENKRGLWQDRQPIAPWDYRHNKKRNNDRYKNRISNF